MSVQVHVKWGQIADDPSRLTYTVQVEGSKDEARPFVDALRGVSDTFFQVDGEGQPRLVSPA